VSYLGRLAWPQVVIIAVVAIVLLFTMLLGGSFYLRCGLRCDAHGLPAGFVTELNLRSHPEASLDYPGSKVLETRVYPEPTSDFDGPAQASIQTQLEATGTVPTDSYPQAIFDWYAAYLTAHGWRAVGQPGSQTFTRGVREIFEVNFNTKVSPDGWVQYSTAYRIVGCRAVNHLYPNIPC